MRVFVTGTHGQLARALAEAAAAKPGLVLGHGARPAMDLERPQSIAPIMAAFAPDVVVNAAAFTAVDLAEAEPERAFAVNRNGAAAVARAALGLGAPVIQISSDYVFDGGKAGAYVEADAPSPLNVYGASKRAAEVAVAEAHPRHVILRAAWLYAPYGGNFVRAVIGLADRGEALRVADDQVGCPTYAPDLAAIILAVAGQIAGGGWREVFAGVTHAAGPEAMAWSHFARAILEGVARRGGRGAPVTAISSAERQGAAARPANSALDSGRLAAVFGLRARPFDAALGDCLDRLIGAAPQAARSLA